MNVSEPSMRCRNLSEGVVKTNLLMWSGISLEGELLTDQTATGIKTA